MKERSEVDDAKDFMRATALMDAGKLDEAEAIFRALIEQYPGRRSLVLNLTALYYKKRDEAQMLECVRFGLNLYPDDRQMRLNGALHLDLIGRTMAAIEEYESILCQFPDFNEARLNLIHLLINAHDFEGAGRQLKTIEDSSERTPEFHFARGRLFLKTQCFPSALEIFEKLLNHDTLHIKARNNAALCEEGLRNYRAAERHLNEAIKLSNETDLEEPLTNRAYIRLEMPSERAEEDFTTLFKSHPMRPLTQWGRLVQHIRPVYEGPENLLKSMSCLDEAVEALYSQHIEGNLRLPTSCISRKNLFYLAYVDQNNASRIRKIMTLFQKEQRICRRSHDLPAETKKNRFVRVGILSAHLRSHSVSNAITTPLVESLSKFKTHIFLYDLDFKPDELTEKFRKLSFRYESGPLEVDKWIEKILADELDVVIYPEIGMDSKTIEIALTRLAPKTYVSWGHPHTSGIDSVDHFISSEMLEPINAEEHYTESLIRLPGLGTCPARLRQKSETGNHALALEEYSEKFLLICPGAPYKYNPIFDWIFAAIAAEFSDVRLIFFNSHIDSHNLTLKLRLEKVFKSAGLDLDDYVAFYPWLAAGDFHALMLNADLMLDTMEFSGFNTVQQALECELPVLTMEGKFMRGRFGAALLRLVGLDHLIATSPEHYLEIFRQIRESEHLLPEARKLIQKNMDRIFNIKNPWDDFVSMICGAEVQK
jgi:protein O-GlcNAc transferase